MFDASTEQAIRSYAEACADLEAATDDAQVLHLSDMRSLAALNLRKALLEAGWTAPVRTSTTS